MSAQHQAGGSDRYSLGVGPLNMTVGHMLFASLATVVIVDGVEWVGVSMARVASSWNHRTFPIAVAPTPHVDDT